MMPVALANRIMLLTLLATPVALLFKGAVFWLWLIGFGLAIVLMAIDFIDVLWNGL